MTIIYNFQEVLQFKLLPFDLEENMIYLAYLCYFSHNLTLTFNSISLNNLIDN